MRIAQRLEPGLHLHACAADFGKARGDHHQIADASRNRIFRRAQDRFGRDAQIGRVDGFADGGAACRCGAAISGLTLAVNNVEVSVKADPGDRAHRKVGEMVLLRRADEDDRARGEQPFKAVSLGQRKQLPVSKGGMSRMSVMR